MGSYVKVVSAILLITFGMRLGETWKCDLGMTVCEVWLEINHKLTMMHDRMLVTANDGHLCNYTEKNCAINNAIPISEVISADGFLEPRIVISINGTMPGPTLEVHENQEIRVTIVNKMVSEVTSMHFHGQHQKGSPWMDGVGFVTQCPILPGQTFTHVFRANPAGTYWYHAHVGSQLSMGMYGAFIVHPATGQWPQYDKEYVLMVQDYNHDWDSTMGFYKMSYGMYVNSRKEGSSSNLSGARYSLFRFQSGLINGKGRYYDNGTNQHNGAPLEIFTVKQNHLYRFRMINSGSVYPFQVSVDGHSLTAVASDGLEIEPVKVDYVILTPGERYDVELNASNTVDNYWIRAISLEAGVNHRTEAILRYEGAPSNVHPASTDRICSVNSKCKAINCPFLYFPTEASTDCVNVEKLVSKDPMPEDIGTGANNIKEYFLNFAFPGTTFTPASVNGIQNSLPSVTALTQPLQMNNRCPGDGYRCDEDKQCHCSSVLDIHDGEVVQLVMTNLGIGKGWDHPIHLHGYSFWIIKVGYPTYSNTSGMFLQDNFDVDCRGNQNRSLSFCNHATWRNQSWLEGGNSVPGLNLNKPVRKDTVNIPTGGYVIARIKVDNPGLWAMHCHVELHVADGMMLLLNASYPNIKPSPPACGSFYAADEAEVKSIYEEEKSDLVDIRKMNVAILVLNAVILVLIVIIIFYIYKRKCRTKNTDSKKSEMNQATDQDPKKQLLKGVVNPAYG